MSKEIKKGQEKIIEGLNKAVDAVEVTLGPAGHSVAITTDFGVVDASRDGANILKTISFKDQEEDIGAQLVKKAAILSESEAGDSTTTTAILTRELVIKGQKAVQTGSNVNEVKAGMLKAGKWVSDYIKSKSISIGGDLEKIRKVATISANNDPVIGDLVVECMKKVGENGVITSELSSGIETTIEVTTGMKFGRGWSSPHYVTSPEDGKCIMEYPYIAVIGEKISSVNQLLPLMEAVIKMGKGRPLLIVCDEMDEIVNSTICLNVLQGALRCCVVKGIDFGDARKNAMEDLAVATGGVHICLENNITLDEVTLEELGAANKVIVSKDNTVIIEGQGDPEKIQSRIDILKARLKSGDVSEYDKSKFETRIANLAGGIAVIKTAAATEVEAQNKKATVDDAVLASKSAIEEGCLPGCGYIYLKASWEMMNDKAFLKSLDGNEIDGVNIVSSSLPIILKTVVSNAGVSADVVIDSIKKSKRENYGFNAKTKKYCDLVENGILDSTKAVRVALENAISTASTILLIDSVIINEVESNPNNQ